MSYITQIFTSIFNWWLGKVQSLLFSTTFAVVGAPTSVALGSVSTANTTLDICIKVFALLAGIAAATTGFFGALVAVYKWKNREKLLQKE